jgi:hypothetical protein
MQPTALMDGPATGVKIVKCQKFSTQYNLFTGELEPLRSDEVPVTGWLFDPDFGVVLPEDVAGREIAITDGVSLAFPTTAGLRVGRLALKKPAASAAIGTRVVAASNGGAFAFPNGGKRYPDAEPWVAQTEDAAQLILSGFGIYLGK